MRYKISNQALDKILKELGDPNDHELEYACSGSFKGQAIDTAKWYLSHVTKTISYHAVIQLNEDWEKKWELTITIDD